MTLDFTDEALVAISEIALQRGNGARGLRGVLEQLLHDLMFSIPSEQHIVRCEVDKEAVQGEGEIKLYFSDEETLTDMNKGCASGA